MKNIETLLRKIIDIHVKGVDVYVNKGSVWLIFTEEKKWVIELDKTGTLWYNYYFFSKIFWHLKHTKTIPNILTSGQIEIIGYSLRNEIPPPFTT